MRGLSLPFDFSNPRHEEVDLIAIEFGDRSNAMEILDEILVRAQRLAASLKRSLAVLRASMRQFQPCSTPRGVIEAVTAALEPAALMVVGAQRLAASLKRSPCRRAKASARE